MNVNMTGVCMCNPDLACIYMCLHVIVHYMYNFTLIWLIFSCFKLCICLMNILFGRILREYCFLLLFYAKFDSLFWFIISQALWNAFFSLLHGPKEMVAPGPHDHFLSFCCGRCLRNHIKHLVRKSDVGQQVQFFPFHLSFPCNVAHFQLWNQYYVLSLS